MKQTRRDFLRNGLLALPPLVCWPGRLWAATVKRPLPSPSLDFIGAQMKLYRRQEWTSTVSKPWLLRATSACDRMTVHHSGESTKLGAPKKDVARDIEHIRAAHCARDYGDIGYHFVVDHAGDVWEGRSLAYEGAHVSAQNDRNIGVALLGNFEKQTPPDAQLNSMLKLVTLLRGRYGIKRHRVYGHRDLAASVCPGKNLYSHVKKLKS